MSDIFCSASQGIISRARCPFLVAFFTCRIGVVHRIVCDISVEVDLILISDGIGLEEAPQCRRVNAGLVVVERSEEHTSELQSLMRISYAVFCLKKKK